jgi:hypothetical protein
MAKTYSKAGADQFCFGLMREGCSDWVKLPWR